MDEDLTYDDFARMALSFAVEDETFIVWLAHILANHVSDRAHDWASMAAQHPDMAKHHVRLLWMDNSPDEAIRELAQRVRRLSN